MTDIFIYDRNQRYVDVFLNFFEDKNEINVVHSCSTTEDLFENLKDLRFDVLLFGHSDFDADGPDIVRKIRKQFPDIKIVMVTDTTDKEFLADIWLRVVEVIIKKPSGSNEIMRAIRTAVSGCKALGKNVPDFRHYLVPKK